MSETFEKSSLKTCEDIPRCIVLPALESGPMPCVSRVGQMPLPFGLAAPHVSRGQPLEKAQDLPTSGTSGHPGSVSSASAALSASLVSRLRARLPYDGLTLFKMTWKERATPSGRRIFALRAVGRRTSGSDCTSSRKTSWPTPNAGPQTDNDSRWEERRAECNARHGNNGFGLTLGMASSLTSWPTPNASGADRGGQAERADGTRSNLIDTAQLAAWNTPKTNDALGVRPDDGRRGVGLNTQAGWATPVSRDWRDRRASPETMARNSRPLNEQAVQLADSGPMPNGATAATASGGQLNPALPRWLMGLPPEWDIAAIRASRSMPKRQRKHGRTASEVTETPSSPRSRPSSSALISKLGSNHDS